MFFHRYLISPGISWANFQLLSPIPPPNERTDDDALLPLFLRPPFLTSLFLKAVKAATGGGRGMKKREEKVGLLFPAFPRCQSCDWVCDLAERERLAFKASCQPAIRRRGAQGGAPPSFPSPKYYNSALPVKDSTTIIVLENCREF